MKKNRYVYVCLCEYTKGWGSGVVFRAPSSSPLHNPNKTNTLRYVLSTRIGKTAKNCQKLPGAKT